MTSASKTTTSRNTVAHVAMLGIIVILAAVVVSLLPIHQSESQPFASPAFQRTWVSEASAATRAVDLWGSEPLAWRVEPYAGAPNERRVVQYFDRGRMEVETGSSEVTQGKLALELTSGQIDLGDGLTLDKQPPDVPIDSSEPDDRVPTWLTLSRVVNEPAADRSAGGERITTWINQSGTYDGDSTPELRRFGEYVEETSHNLPDVTVKLFQRPEFQDERWVESFGYPISEPYWTHYRRNDEVLPALVQVFERRVLIYTPGIEEARTFTIPSIGRHYATWRYGSEPSTEQTMPPKDAFKAEFMLGDQINAWIHADDLGTPVDLALSSTGHLMILTAEGVIYKAESLDPDGSRSDFTVWASGIDEPQGLTARGDAVIVTAGSRVWFYYDKDGQGVPNEAGNLLHDGTPTPVEHVVRGKPVQNSAGDVFNHVESDTGQQVLSKIGSDDPLIELHELLDEPGPVEFASGDLLLAGQDHENRAGILLLPSVLRSASDPKPQTIASFPANTQIRAIAVVNEDLWAISELGDVLVAVQDEDTARILAVSRNQRIDEENEVEVVELVSGLSRPTAIEIGLDGSFYVTDADTGRVYRIQYTG